MLNKVTKVMETERLILRPFEINDANDMFINWCCDPEVTKYLTWSPHENLEDSQKIAKLWHDQAESNSIYQWAIELKSIQQVIGSIGIVRDNPETKTGELGYAIGRKFWHQGITTEAANAVIPYLFECGYERIQAIHDVKNPNSGKVLEKVGMTKEGILRKHAKNNQGIVDVAIYGILKQ